MATEGSCYCGLLTYRLSTDALPEIYACHCLGCQKLSGSAFALYAMLLEGALEVQGTATTYEHIGPSGFRSVQHLCTECHTRIYNTNEAAAGAAFLRAGTLNNSIELEPVAHIWTKQMQRWINLPADVTLFEESPTPEEFARALAAAKQI